MPQFVGVGNGTLQVLGVGAAAPLQSLTFTLADLGVQTTHAGLDVREARLVAKAAGSAGNAISVTVEPLLTRTPTAWALLADWATGQDVQTGPQWDFGGLPLSPKDELDAASPRIAFGFDPEVYRPWRRFRNGQWEFGLSPALQRAVAKGTPVHAVTGGYKVTITDGVTTEVYGDTAALPVPQPAVVTFYDLLTQLAASALVDVAAHQCLAAGAGWRGEAGRRGRAAGGAHADGDGALHQCRHGGGRALGGDGRRERRAGAGHHGRAVHACGHRLHGAGAGPGGGGQWRDGVEVFSGLAQRRRRRAQRVPEAAAPGGERAANGRDV